MPVTFVGANSGGFASTRSPVVTYPGGVQDGDLILFGAAENGTTAPAAPAGTTTVYTSGTFSNLNNKLAWFGRRTASGEGATFTLTNLWSTTRSGEWIVVVFRGADPTTPINASAGSSRTGTSGAWTSATVVPTLDNCLIATLNITSETTATHSPDTSPACTEYWDAHNTWNSAAQGYTQTTAASVALDSTFSAGVAPAAVIVAIAPAPTFQPQAVMV